MGSATTAIGMTTITSTTNPAIDTAFTQRFANAGAQRRIKRPTVSGASTVPSMIAAILSTATFAPKSAAATGTNTTASTDATTKRPIVYPASPPPRSAFCGKNGGIGATASAISTTFTIGRSANCETITATNRGTITFIATSARPSFAGRLSSHVASAKLARNPIASTVRTIPMRAASEIQVIMQCVLQSACPRVGSYRESTRAAARSVRGRERLRARRVAGVDRR
jgi:hypothetical protein